jgi:hypothetical protein
MTQVSGTRWTKNRHSTSSRKTLLAVGLLLTVLGAIFVSLSPSAGAATEATVPPITGPDLATYPQDGIFPNGCTHDGPSILVGVNYAITHNGVTRNATVLNTEQLFIGDSVTMSWTDYAPGCEGVGISLAVKSTDHSDFVITDNQKLVSYQYCSGSDCGGNGTSFGNLTIKVPSKQDACNFQFDAVIGPPLSVVGPNGSYYTRASRAAMGKAHPDDRDMLIGYSNGGKGECVPPTASATQSCTTSSGVGVDVAIVNPDPNDDATVDVLKNGVALDSNVNVPVGQTVHVIVPFNVNESGNVSVNWTGSAGPVTPAVEIFNSDFTFDCNHAGVTITNSCSQGGVVMDFTNTGDAPAVLTVKKNGTVIDTVTVDAHGTAQRTYAMAEDETSSYRVSGGGFDSGIQSITHDCVQATSTTQGSTTTTTEPDTVQGTEVTRGALPRTGSGSTLPLSTMAGLLLMTGGILLALANRPLPAGATASDTRSRGR